MSFRKDKVQKVHRERPQPEERAHLGMLERKKDYKIRAKDHQKKKETIKKLKRKAEDRNPDEFYFNMTRTKKVDGDHMLREDAQPVVTREQRKLMESQDKKYVQFRLTKELRKIEKLKQSLHLIDSSEKKNTHIIFVENEKEAKNFDAAKFFDTHPAFVDRAFNRPKMDALKNGQFLSMSEEGEADMKSKTSAYVELSRRIDRAKELKIILEKLDAKINMKDKKRKRKLVQAETKTSAAHYKFSFRRQK